MVGGWGVALKQTQSPTRESVCLPLLQVGGEKGEKEDGELKEQQGNEWERLKFETNKKTRVSRYCRPDTANEYFTAYELWVGQVCQCVYTFTYTIS